MSENFELIKISQTENGEQTEFNKKLQFILCVFLEYINIKK